MAKYKKTKRDYLLNNNNKTQEPSINDEDSIFGDIDQPEETASKTTSEQTSQDILKEIEKAMSEGAYREHKEISSINDQDEGADAKVFQATPIEPFKEEKPTKFKKPKKPKKTYEHTTWAHKMRVLAVLLVLGIFSGSGLGVWYFNYNLRSTYNPFDFNAEDFVQSVSDTFKSNDINATKSDGLSWVEKAQAQGLTPADITPADNYILAEYNMTLANSYIINGSGYVNATALGVPAKQSITSRKKFNGSYHTFESISPSSFKGLGLPDIVLCDKYSGGNSVSLYTSKSLKPSKSDWTYSQDMDKDDYLFESGSLPSSISPYIVSSKTVIDGTNSKDIIEYNEENDTYTFTMNLHKQKSVINYSKQVRRTGGLSGYPEFEYINFTVTIDSNWNLISYSVKEKYYALKMGTKATCTGVLNNTITLNCEVDMPV